jgi:hypothetical protein
MSAKEYVKHLVECKCILPQFKQVEPVRWHCFVVFSEIDELGMIIPSFAQCNNCGTIHKVTEVGISSVLSKDNLASLPKIDEIKTSLQEKLVKVLESYDCELPTYQEVQFIIEHQLWGRTVILSKEVLDGMLLGKYLLIIGETLWKVNSFQEELKNDE